MELVGEIPATPIPGSARASETLSLDASGGAAQAQLLDRMNLDGQLMVGHLALVVDGVADLLEVGSSRGDAINAPALSLVVRSALEVAGQLAWLLEDSLDATGRARRFLTWRFADLRSQRLLLREFQLPDPEREAAEAELDDAENELITEVVETGWRAKGTLVGPKGELECAALLDAAGKREAVPKFNQLVRLVSSWPSVYGLLSVPAHGTRFGVMHGLQVDPQADEADRYDTRFGGFGIPPNSAVGLAILAVDHSCRLLAGWNAVDASQLHSDCIELMRRVGIT